MRGEACRRLFLQGSTAATHNSLLLIEVEDVPDFVLGPGVFGNDAPHQLGSPERDVTAWFQHVVGGKVEGEKVAR